MIQEWFASITPKHWSDCIDHVKEKVYWASDIARDEMLEPVVITLTEGDEETDTADEFEDDMSNYTSTCIVRNEMIENKTNKKIKQKYKKFSIRQF